MRPAIFMLVCATALLMAVATAYAAPPERWQRQAVEPNPYVGMSLAEIKALPEFVPIENAPQWFNVPSSARESADRDAPPAFTWIGYIELPREEGRYAKYVVLDSAGAGVTMRWDGGGCYDEIVPVWFVGTFDFLAEKGVIEGYY